jgi:hypothetical protein
MLAVFGVVLWRRVQFESDALRSAATGQQRKA